MIFFRVTVFKPTRTNKTDGRSGNFVPVCPRDLNCSTNDDIMHDLGCPAESHLALTAHRTEDACSGSEQAEIYTRTANVSTFIPLAFETFRSINALQRDVRILSAFQVFSFDGLID